MLYPGQEYKIVTIKELINSVKIPDFQRLLNENRVNEIYKEIKKETNNFVENPVLPGVLIICQSKKGEWLVDGNHRFHVYSIIYQRFKVNLNVMVNYIKVADAKEAELIFNKVNKSVALPAMPKGSSVCVSKEVTAYFLKTYGKIFSGSSTATRANRPHLHLGEFQENIGQVTKFNTMLNSKQIIDKIEAYNAVLSKKTWKAFVTKKKESETKVKNWIEKCNKFKCYLGLQSGYDWLFKLFKIKNKDVMNDDDDDNDDDNKTDTDSDFDVYSKDNDNNNDDDVIDIKDEILLKKNN